MPLQVERKTPLQRKAERPFWILAFILIIASSVLVVFTLIKFFLYPYLIPDEKTRTAFVKALEQVGGGIGYYVDRVLNALGILDGEEKQALLEIERITRKYPFPGFFPLLQGKFPATALGWAILASEVLFAGLTGAFLYFLDFKFLKSFFLRSAAPETPLEMGDSWPASPENFTGVEKERIESYFVEGGLDEFMRTVDARIPKPNSDDRYGVIRTDDDRVEKEEREKGRIVYNRSRIEREVRKSVEELEDYGKKLLLVRKGEEESFRVSLGFSLYHHVLDFFSGVPLGFVTPRLKDYTLKRVLASYGYRDKVPITKFQNDYRPHEERPSRFLTALHGYCRERKDLYEHLKDEFCQIPGWDELIPIKRKTT